jgi:hypothetical protein
MEALQEDDFANENARDRISEPVINLRESHSGKGHIKLTDDDKDSK